MPYRNAPDYAPPLSPLHSTRAQRAWPCLACFPQQRHSTPLVLGLRHSSVARRSAWQPARSTWWRATPTVTACRASAAYRRLPCLLDINARHLRICAAGWHVADLIRSFAIRTTPIPRTKKLRKHRPAPSRCVTSKLVMWLRGDHRNAQRPIFSARCVRSRCLPHWYATPGCAALLYAMYFLRLTRHRDRVSASWPARLLCRACLLCCTGALTRAFHVVRRLPAGSCTLSPACSTRLRSARTHLHRTARFCAGGLHTPYTALFAAAVPACAVTHHAPAR